MLLSKDHKPGGFVRMDNDYRSDLEIAEMERGTRINTSFSSGNANVYVHNAEHTHEHFWYEPANLSSGWHGENWATHNNHPDPGKAAGTITAPDEKAEIREEAKEDMGTENTALEQETEGEITESVATETEAVEDELDDGPDEDLDDDLDL